MDNVRAAASSDGDGQVAESPLAWKTRDVVVAAALAVPLGIVFYVWLIGWNAAQLVPPLAHFVGGLYVLAGVLVALDARLRPRYPAPANAVDVEFLVTAAREIVVVQARPYTVN